MGGREIMAKKTETVPLTSYNTLMDAAVDLLTENDDLKSQLRGQSFKIANQRLQLQMYQEKMELMKGWKGIARTIGQRLGVSK